MPKLVVNAEERALGTTPHTWGELLAHLDAQLTASGEVVTAVRFDGVDEPSFRTPAALVALLAATALVEVEAARPNDLLAQSAAHGAAAVAALCQATSDVGARFRGYDIGAANRSLIELADGLRILAGLLAGTSAAVGVSLDEIDVNGDTASALVVQLGQMLDQLIATQRNEDWVSVADILEYDIEPSLRRWRLVFDELQARVVAAGRIVEAA